MQRVAVYLHNYSVTHSSRYVSETSTRDSIKSERIYAESVTSHRSNVSRMSELSSRSSVKEKRIEAAKANLALRLAEEEQRRAIEGELRLHDIEKNQGELTREQKLKEELKRSSRLEVLKQDTDRKLAGVRQQAALMTLEVQLEENIDDNKVIDMDLMMETRLMPSTHLYEGEIPPPYIEDPSIHESFQYDTTYPVFTPQREVRLASSSYDLKAKNQNGHMEKIMAEFPVERMNPPHSGKIPAFPRLEREEFMTNAQNLSNPIPYRELSCPRSPITHMVVI